MEYISLHIRSCLQIFFSFWETLFLNINNKPIVQKLSSYHMCHTSKAKFPHELSSNVFRYKYIDPIFLPNAFIKVNKPNVLKCATIVDMSGKLIALQIELPLAVLHLMDFPQNILEQSFLNVKKTCVKQRFTWYFSIS